MREGLTPLWGSNPEKPQSHRPFMWFYGQQITWLAHFWAFFVVRGCATGQRTHKEREREREKKKVKEERARAQESHKSVLIAQLVEKSIATRRRCPCVLVVNRALRGSGWVLATVLMRFDETRKAIPWRFIVVVGESKCCQRFWLLATFLPLYEQHLARWLPLWAILAHSNSSRSRTLSLFHTHTRPLSCSLFTLCCCYVA